MANEQYRFDMNTDASQVYRTISDLNNRFDQLSGKMDGLFSHINTSGINNNMTITEKSMDKAYRSMQAMTGEANNLKSAIQSAFAYFNSNRDWKGALGMSQELSNVNDKLNQTKHSFAELTNMRQTRSSAFKIDQDDKSMEQYNQNIREQQRKIVEIRSLIAEQRRNFNIANRYSNQAMHSGYLSYQQASDLHGALDTGKRINGSTISQIDQQYGSYMAQRQELINQRTTLQKNGSVNATEITRVNNLISAIDPIIKKLNEASVEARNFAQKMDNIQSTVNSNAPDWSVRPKRNTLQSMLTERAPAIGLNAMLAGTAVFGGLYGRGSNIMGQIRPDIAYMENQAGGFGNSVYGRFGGRNDASYIHDMQSAGAQYGFNTTDTTSFYTTMMGMAGYTGNGNMARGASQMMNFARATGSTADETTGLFGALGAQGGINGASQIRGVQQAIVGAIKESGMEGRGKQQVQALQTIAQGTFSGRDISNEDIQNMLGTQTALAMTGRRSLQGASGAQAITSMSQDIQGGASNPLMSYLMGFGSKYTGLSGMWSMQEQQQKGATPENIQTVMSSLMSMSGGNTDMAKTIFKNNLFPQLTTDQVNGLFKSYNQGDFSQRSIEKILKDIKKTGKEQSDKSVETYNKSQIATQEKAIASMDKMATSVYDLGGAIRKVIPAASMLPAPLYAMGAAAIAVAVQLGLTLASLKGSEFLQKTMSKSYSDTNFGGGGAGGGSGKKRRPPRRGGGGGLFSRTVNTARGGMANFWGKITGKGPLYEYNTRQSTKSGARGASGSGFFSRTINTARGGMSNLWGKITGKGPLYEYNASQSTGSGSKNIFSGALRKGASKIRGLGGGSTALKGLGIAGTLLGVYNGIQGVLSAPEGHKGEAGGNAVGNVGGSIAGGLAGAKGGAAIGTAFSPGVGTLVGGAIGSIGGSIAGSGLGSWLGGKVGGLFDWGKSDDKNKESTLSRATQNENKRKRNNQDQKDQTHEEKNNLNFAQKLLNQARTTGGILGSLLSGNLPSSNDFVKGTGKDTKKTIQKAMNNAGVSGDKWANGLSYIIQKESSGNPNAVGKKTSSGTAKGLMQLKDFNIDGNPFDPVNNVQSGIEYIKKRYKTIDNAVAHWKKYHWYAQGTGSSAGSNVVLGDGGEHELVRTPEGKVGFSPNKPTVYNNFPQGSSVTPLSKIPVLGSSGSGKSGGEYNVNVTVTVDRNGNVNMDTRQLTSIGQQIATSISNPMHFFSKTMQRT